MIMPTILALETSSNACSVALLTDGGVVEDTVVLPREHTQRLLPMVEGLLKAQSTSLSDLDAIAYGAGPGSFTGLRICLSIAQGLAYGADLPLISVSSLLAMARTAHRRQNADTGSVIIPVIDARMDEVYWGAYQIHKDGSSATLSDEQVSTPEHCSQYIASLASQPIIAVGSGWQYDALVSLINADLDAYPSAYDVAVIASAQWAAGEILSPLEASPTYLRNEVSWKKRQRIRTAD